jgi:hypothetical protein
MTRLHVNAAPAGLPSIALPEELPEPSEELPPSSPFELPLDAPAPSSPLSELPPLLEPELDPEPPEADPLLLPELPPDDDELTPPSLPVLGLPVSGALQADAHASDAKTSVASLAIVMAPLSRGARAPWATKGRVGGPLEMLGLIRADYTTLAPSNPLRARAPTLVVVAGSASLPASRRDADLRRLQHEPLERRIRRTLPATSLRRTPRFTARGSRTRRHRARVRTRSRSAAGTSLSRSTTMTAATAGASRQ